MGLGSLLFGLIGALVRWIFSGFRKKFMDIYRPERVYEDGFDVATTEMVNVWVGVATIIVLLIIFHEKLHIF